MATELDREDTRPPLAPGDCLSIRDGRLTIEELDVAALAARFGTPLYVHSEAQCRDNAHLLEVLNDGVRAIDGVTGTETFVYLDLVKQTYPWPPN